MNKRHLGAFLNNYSLHYSRPRRRFKSCPTAPGTININMKQYRITSDHFVLPGETGEADAFMDPRALTELKKLAGITGLLEAEAGVYTGQNTVPQATEDGIESPVGSNITNTAQYRNQLLEKYQVRPGDELWFMINFEPVRGLGEAAGHLEQKIQAYFKKYPEKRPENRPQLPSGA